MTDLLYDPLLVWAAHGISSVVSLSAFGWDKLCAIRGRRRVPEARLLFLALMLGFPGAWLGVRLFRHKSSKPSFLLRLALVTLVSGALVTWFLIRVHGAGVG